MLQIPSCATAELGDDRVTVAEQIYVEIDVCAGLEDGERATVVGVRR